MDVFDEMLEIVARIKYGQAGTDSDIIPVRGQEVRDAFLKVGVMLAAAAGVEKDELVEFIEDFYDQQEHVQDKV